jgi:hypothetical protein
MDQKVTHEQIADRFKCSERLVRDVKKNRKKYETEAAAGRGGSKKNVRTGNNPEVRYSALVFQKNTPSSRAFFALFFFCRALFAQSFFFCKDLFL